VGGVLPPDAGFAPRRLPAQWQGKKFYFIGEETRRESAKQNKIPIC
jgi:hypothetical protein